MKILAIFLTVGLTTTSCRPGQKLGDKNENDLIYLYYPTPEDKVEIVFNDTKSLLSANLKPNTTTMFIFDGFTSWGDSFMNQATKNAFSGRSDMNVIIVDWRVHSGFGRPIETPEQGLEIYLDIMINELPIVGSEFADFVHFLNENVNISYSDVIIVGHSMGAHTACVCGRTVISKYNNTVGRIIGEDPSLQFSELDAPMRLQKGDAEVVEVYITNREYAGDMFHTVGDVTIFVNGGNTQPCKFLGNEIGIEGDIGIMCDDHGYSHMLYNFLGTNGTVQYKACPCMGARCLCKQCEIDCETDGIVIGPNIPESARGSFHVKTDALDPW